MATLELLRNRVNMATLIVKRPSTDLVVRGLPRLELGGREVLVAADQGAQARRGEVLKGKRNMYRVFE